MTAPLVMLDGAMVEPDEAMQEAMLIAPDTSVPASVTARQALLALLEAGLLDDVEAAIAGASRAAQIEWQRGTTIERASPLIAEIGGALGLSDAQIDDLFRAAAAL